jgi:hypothetical protein
MDEPRPKPRIRLFFSLSNLLILTAGMAAMQPWRTWEPDPTEVNYDVKVVRVKTTENLAAAENAKLLTDLANIYKPNKTVLIRPAANMELLSELTLTAMTKSEAVYDLANAPPGPGAAKLDSLKVKLKPYKAEDQIESIIEGSLYFANENPDLSATMQSTSTGFAVRPGATEVIELRLNPKSPQGKDGLRYFVVVTPSLPPTFAWVASSPGAKPVLQKKK